MKILYLALVFLFWLGCSPAHQFQFGVPGSTDKGSSVSSDQAIVVCQDWPAAVLYVTEARGLSVKPVTIENDEFFSDIDISKFALPPTTNPLSASLVPVSSFEQKDALKNPVPYKNGNRSYETRLHWNEGGQQITLHLSNACLEGHGSPLGKEIAVDDCASIEGGPALSGSGIFKKWVGGTAPIYKYEIRFDLPNLKGVLNLEEQMGRLDFNDVTCQATCPFDSSLSQEGNCHYQCSNGLQGDYKFADTYNCDESGNHCTGVSAADSIISGAAVIEECHFQGIILPANFVPKIEVSL